MLQALLAGVASIKAQQTRINVIGDNLANVNTTAYKGSRVTFQDMLSQTMRGASRPTATLGGTNPVQFGLGVILAGLANDEDQGSLEATNRQTDLAIQGGGYFMVSNGQRTAYTRDGSFDFDASGTLVHRGTGERLLGWTATTAGQIDTSKPVSSTSFINIPIGQLSAVRQSTNVSYVGNLSAGAASTDTWTASISVYDSVGRAHALDVVFKNRTAIANNTPPGAVESFDWEADEGGVKLADSSTAGNTKLFFGTDGKMLNETGAQTSQTVKLSPTGAAPMTLTLDLSAVGSLATVTQVQATAQDGFPPGSLSGFNIDPGGTITGIFTNGLTRPLGQIAIALFPNAAGLERLGNNLARDTDNSGLPVIGTPGTNGKGSLNAGFLEQSNVDIGTEFTDLIVTQRGFQANTKVVTTVDQMLQDLLNMKQ